MARATPKGLVLRVKPTQHTVFMESDFDSQYKVLSALGQHTNVPVPTMKWFEDDDRYLGAPFFALLFMFQSRCLLYITVMEASRKSDSMILIRRTH